VGLAKVDFDTNGDADWVTLLERAEMLFGTRIPKRLLNVSNNPIAAKSSAGLAEEQAISDEYAAILAELDTLLQPALSQCLAPEFVNGRDVVFLINNPSLSRLPFEALSHFAGARSLSRDFSLPLLLRRLQAQKSKGASLRRSGVTYIVDPRKEDVAGDKGSCQVFQAIRTRVSSEWRGVLGTERVPVAGEFQRFLSGSSAFVFMGFCRFLSEFEPGLLAALPCSNSSFVQLADLAVNMASFRRQNKLDNSKAPSKKQLELPFNVAFLLSLRGVDSVLLNQFACTPTWNAERMDAFWSHFGKAVSCGASLQATRTQPPSDSRAYAAFNTVLYGLPSITLPEK
jgi:hypothetical protein